MLALSRPQDVAETHGCASDEGSREGSVDNRCTTSSMSKQNKKKQIEILTRELYHQGSTGRWTPSKWH
jgi:hypothetical protein